MLQRTQIILDSELKSQLELISRRENRSISAVVRTILKKHVPKHLKKTTKKISGTQFLLDLAKNPVHGPGDSEYDKYAYDL